MRKRSNKHQLFCFTCILEIFLEAGFKKASRVLNRFLLYVKLCKNSRWFVGNNDDEQISAIICHCLIFQEWRIGIPDENAYTNPPFFDQVYSTHLSLIITNTRLIGKLDWITFLSGGEGERARWIASKKIKRAVGRLLIVQCTKTTAFITTLPSSK